MDHMEEILCNCTGVTYQDVINAIENGATSFEEVQEATGCSTVCGACEDEARNFVSQMLKK